jgi:ribose transport system substrate-binding protein
MHKRAASRLAPALVLAIGLIIGLACEQKPAAPKGEGETKGPATPSGPSTAPPGSGTAPQPGAGPAGKAPGKTLRFAFIPKALHIPVFSYARTGANRQAKLLGNVEILWNAPTTNDQVKQKEILETYIAQGVDGIAISCLNGDYLTPTINEAVDKGIPVITWDSDAPKSKRIAFYGVNDFKSGEIMANELVKLLAGQGGEIAILTTAGADNLAQRLEGAMSVIRQHPEIKVINTIDIEDDALKTKTAVETTMASTPNLRAWLSVGGWPGFSRNILDPVDPKKTLVISFDTIPPALDIIKEGKIQLALGQKYFGWGSVPCKLLYDIVVNKKNPPSPIIDSGVDVVTPENVDAYLEKWKKMEAGEVVE